MRKNAVILVAIGLMTGMTAAVVGHNGSGDGDMSITSGSSASATSAVTENGTAHTGKVEMTGRTQNQTSNELRNISYSDHQRVEFSGTITAGTPCHVIDQELNETGENTYVLNIKTVKDELDDQACAEVVTGINYDAEFEADSGFRLEIQHNGETIDTLEDRVVEEEPEPSLFQRILNFLGL
jgi:ABC-type microcin C transport system duplicated ATPase subunit YejF